MPGRYIPPHLRGREASSNNSNGTGTGTSGTSSSTSKPFRSESSSNGGSRWNNIDNRGNNDRNGHRYGGRNDNHYNNETSNAHRNGGRSSAGTPGGGKSRWANVDRSAIASGNHSSSRYGNNYNNNYSNNGRFNSSQDNRQKFANVEAIFFGDSFIKLFGLLNDYSDSVLKAPQKIEVQKYKAASAKGLCRDGNENRAKIFKTIETVRRQNELRNNSNSNNNPSTRAYQDLERLVFCFGSVDVHMSFYFKKYVQGQPLTDDDLRAIAIDYVDFVADLETTNATDTSRKPLTKLIVGIYPSPLCDKDVGSSLLAYGSLENEDQVSAVNDSDDKHIELRQARVDLFNQAIRERCDYHNSQETNNGTLEYWDVREELLTQDEINQRLKVKDAYKDVSDLNIHLIHETTLQLWVKKWPWYEALTTTSGSNSARGRQASFLEYLQETFDEYRKTKPWAERTHVAETNGIQLA
eukprot:CAMPEP_0116146670 /NCGR_PEP_ID=MMETSP0329-20121206/17294_1 /TAXON_ID=697910 /ORGANISM="Pseudo-nitzschia arenysensis, Strain B593" /LENGTH=466 /DNA_ID=CAMNT_0003642445 /DNA_START=29 /DNA_END=1429 /DNA_ORIENTATION=+